MKHEIELGDEVRDTITGFSGVAMARTEWLTGCDRISIQPRGLNKEHKPHEYQTFDVGTVEVVKKAKKKREPQNTGGPRPEIKKY